MTLANGEKAATTEAAAWGRQHPKALLAQMARWRAPAKARDPLCEYTLLTVATGPLLAVAVSKADHPDITKTAERNSPPDLNHQEVHTELAGLVRACSVLSPTFDHLRFIFCCSGLQRIPKPLAARVFIKKKKP